MTLRAGVRIDVRFSNIRESLQTPKPTRQGGWERTSRSSWRWFLMGEGLPQVHVPLKRENGLPFQDAQLTL